MKDIIVRPGLVSISFRSHSPENIVKAFEGTGLEGIEWGGDVHAPHGDLLRARHLAALCRDAGIAIAVYGSYLRFAEGDPDWNAVLDSAEALGAPLIRVWAGRAASASFSPTARLQLVEKIGFFVADAAERKLRVAVEYHADTLTDTDDSAIALLHAVPGLQSLWQPPHRMSFHSRAESLRRIQPFLANLHVFNWGYDGKERRSLAEAAEAWTEYLRIAQAGEGEAERWALLEFMSNDEISALRREAELLRKIITQESDR
ncbi:sugar phosphate isomerase/epimerase [Treponema sp.]